MESKFPVVLLEFNELSPVLMERFIRDGKLPNFQRLRDQSEVFHSEAEERAPNLEPWIQWVNVHTGVPYADHGIFQLSEGHKVRHQCIWETVSNAGGTIWICGSMNVRYDQGIRGCILPDPWSTDVAPYPDTLSPYFRFIQQNVLEHTNERVPLTTSDYVDFLRFMVRHGLSIPTVTSIVKQLSSEKLSHGGRWRRAFIMDKLQFDVFSAIYRRLKPTFSTFFLNSTAHMQHMYWRNMEPELFTVAPKPEEQREFATAVLLGYREMDELVGRMMRLVGDQSTLILATGLSQQACLLFESAGGKRAYRPRDFEVLLNFAGITSAHRVAPVMAEQFYIHMENASDAAVAETKLSRLRVAERQAIETRRDGSSIFTSCAINVALEPDAILQNSESGKSIPFSAMFYRIEEVKSGMHHPDGILWVRHPTRAHRIHPDKVSLTSIAPTILDLLGLKAPASMKGLSLLAKDRGLHAQPDYASPVAS